MDPAPERVPDAARLLGLVSGSWKTQAAFVAARLRIADHLAGAPRTAAELAAATGAHPPSLHRFLRALATIELVRENEDGTFALTSMGALLEDDAPDSLRWWVLHWGGASWAVWGHLHHSVMTGESARSLVTGTRGFEHLARDPEAAEIFHRAMTELTRLVARDFVHAVDWSTTKRIVDVGGGYGELLASALLASPGAVGVLFDTEHAIDRGRAHLRAAGLEHRVEFVAGDFFDWVPRGADTYLLKSVIHDWDDERGAEILASCRRAIPPEGRLLLIERLVPERLGTSPDDQGLACSDLHMLVQLAARERTESELRALLAGADFRTARVSPLRSTLALIEARPASAQSA
ncbi:MAG TPA: methyltransferase [Gemmatimonadota bacterium]